MKALDTYLDNMWYLETMWSEKEIKQFALLTEQKIISISHNPGIGSSRNKKNKNIRHTVLHKRVSLIYRVNNRKKQIELLLFWNTWQNPSKLKAK